MSKQSGWSFVFRELASFLFVCCHLTSFTFAHINKKLFMPSSQIAFILLFQICPKP